MLLSWTGFNHQHKTTYKYRTHATTKKTKPENSFQSIQRTFMHKLLTNTIPHMQMEMKPNRAHLTSVFLLLLTSASYARNTNSGEKKPDLSETALAPSAKTPTGGVAVGIGGSGFGHGRNWNYNWGWGSSPGGGWGYGSGSGRSPNGPAGGWGYGAGYGFGSGTGTGSGSGYGSGGHGGDHGTGSGSNTSPGGN
ncbi:glycine-rich cell wall structural protein 2-like [Papaver somniferum]|uniref:glycine-rich cell wall structural protein 2-like n=1 Tax=Papaver somniferum TaxID=3469 RepID=UPI000E700992|nr:glycine-rich cell wall structural protein 2-like [Papaver somniferum]